MDLYDYLTNPYFYSSRMSHCEDFEAEDDYDIHTPANMIKGSNREREKARLLNEPEETKK